MCKPKLEWTDREFHRPYDGVIVLLKEIRWSGGGFAELLAQKLSTWRRSAGNSKVGSGSQLPPCEISALWDLRFRSYGRFAEIAGGVVDDVQRRFCGAPSAETVGLVKKCRKEQSWILVLAATMRNFGAVGPPVPKLRPFRRDRRGRC